MNRVSVGWGRWRCRPPVIELWYGLRLVGLRDRLRCPRCSAVGTWKPHGTRRERARGDRPARRWMCKWCGFYCGPEGVREARPDWVIGSWQLVGESANQGPSPREAVAEALGKTNPWHG